MRLITDASRHIADPGDQRAASRENPTPHYKARAQFLSSASLDVPFLSHLVSPRGTTTKVATSKHASGEYLYEMDLIPAWLH